jgi:hypothetical protein
MRHDPPDDSTFRLKLISTTSRLPLCNAGAPHRIPIQDPKIDTVKI